MLLTVQVTILKLHHLSNLKKTNSTKIYKTKENPNLIFFLKILNINY